MYINEHPDYTYEEHGIPYFPSSCTLKVPVFERLDEEEEKKLGANGLRKEKVGFLEVEGGCEVGCARVRISKMRVLKVDGEVVWEWRAD